MADDYIPVSVTWPYPGVWTHPIALFLVRFKFSLKKKMSRR